MTAESGLEHMPGNEVEFGSSTANAFEGQDPETAEPLPDLALLDQKIAEAIAAMKDESGGDKRKAKQRKEDLMRLKRIEQIYVSIRPML